MYILYLDDSGSAPNTNEDYLVLGGVAVLETDVWWFTKQLDEIAESLSPGAGPTVEFHAAEVYRGRTPPWSSIRERSDRQDIIKRVLGVLSESYPRNRAFACAVHKASFPNADPMELAFEDVCSRFDMFLQRLQNSAGAASKNAVHKGLIVLDRSTYETTLHQLTRKLRTAGTQWGRVIRNLAEMPLFIDSTVSRLTQLADHVAYACFRYYNANDVSYFRVIESRFDEEDGKLHGLVHKQTRNPRCMCPACITRRQ
ncbi:MAG: hypothetical protein KatS3mg015_1949 [Fimbriimonadales bacterium]|nr:MAG: hypothetical protein KatS3mg015_1949 [Fimbriimonadales bacterium]